MTEDRFSFVIPRRAVFRVIVPKGESGFVRIVRVQRAFQRNGYATKLFAFATRYVDEVLELDIKVQSRVAQRIACRMGYRRVGPSKRFFSCDLWASTVSVASFPWPRLELVSNRTYRRKTGRTEVIYLKDV